MRAYDWLLFATVFAGYAMRGCLDNVVLNIFLRLTECLSLMTAREVDDAHIRALESSVVEFLCLLELKFPKTELGMVYHLMLHVVEHVRDWGPAPCTWMFPYERFLGFLCRHIKNRSHVVANATRFYREYSHVRSQRAVLEAHLSDLSIDSEFVRANTATEPASALPQFGSQDVTLHGHSHIRILDAPLFRVLCAGLRSVSPVYDLLCSEFAAESKGNDSMDVWTPNRELSPEERELIVGPSYCVQEFAMANIRGREFRAAEWETSRNSRSSYFSVTAIDGKSVEYGRILHFWEATFGRRKWSLVHVEIYKSLSSELVCAPYPDDGVAFELPRVDTSRKTERRLVKLADICGQIVLGPPDNRLKSSIDDRFTGPCIVMQYANC